MGQFYFGDPGQFYIGTNTWDSAVSRTRVRDCANLLGKLIPVIIEIMVDHPQHDWGTATYPVVKVMEPSKRRA